MKWKRLIVAATVTIGVGFVLPAQEPELPAPGLPAQKALAPLQSAPRARAGGEWFRHWEMESRVAQSQLILVARVSNVSALTVVHGAKVDTTLREYRFQPVRRLKGVFSRDELAMTSSDLGLPEADGTQPPPIQQGEFRLLMLTRTQQGGYSCTGPPNMALNPEQQVPRLAGPDDPIAAMTATLVRVSESPSRRERAELVIAQLDDAEGPAAVPLVKSLASRAFWAGQMPPTAEPLARLAGDDSAAIRTVAVQTMEQVLAAGSFGDDSKALAACADRLRGLIEAKHTETAVRAAALRAVGLLGEFGRRLPWTTALLTRNLEQARTYSERTAAASALAHLNDPKAAQSLLAAVEQLPLDEFATREQTIVESAVRLAGREVVPVLIQRLRRKLAAEHYAIVEIAHLGALGDRAAIPALIDAARVAGPYGLPTGGLIQGTRIGRYQYRGWSLDFEQQIAISYAFEQMKDERAVPSLAHWLHSPNQYLRQRTLAALDAIDSEAAVAAVRLRLKAEPDLALKLRMARTIGRHGFGDGYPFAIEHLADPGITDFAAAALGAIRDPRTNGGLWKVLETSHDQRWNAAALAGLAAVGDAKVKDRLLQLLAASRDPLLADAAAAAAYLATAKHSSRSPSWSARGTVGSLTLPCKLS